MRERVLKQQTPMFHRFLPHLLEPLKIERFVRVDPLELLVGSDVGVDEGLHEASELVLTLVHDDVRPPDDELRAASVRVARHLAPQTSRVLTREANCNA